MRKEGGLTIMSKRAEEAALRAYPVDMTPLVYQDLIDRFGGKTEIDFNTYPRCLFQEGYELAEKDLGWHPSTEHPPVDEEVIVLADIITKGGLNVGFGRIAFGHIVDKSVAIDYNGWNIPGVKFWMPMPRY